MNYTNEQYALLASFEKGRNIDDLTESELWGYQFLMEQGLLQPRADIENGWHLLSEKGKCVLNEKRQLDEKTNQEASQLAKDNAKAKKAKASDRLHDFVLVLFGSLVTVLIEHFGDIVLWVKEIIQKHT